MRFQNQASELTRESERHEEAEDDKGSVADVDEDLLEHERPPDVVRGLLDEQLHVGIKHRLLHLQRHHALVGGRLVGGVLVRSCAVVVKRGVIWGLKQREEKFVNDRNL